MFYNGIKSIKKYIFKQIFMYSLFYLRNINFRKFFPKVKFLSVVFFLSVRID